MTKMTEPHCEFCDRPPTWIHVPTYGPWEYGCRLSCDLHRHWVRRLIVVDLGSGYTRELQGCSVCNGPVTTDRLPPAYATPVCHGCLPPPDRCTECEQGVDAMTDKEPKQ